MLSYTDGFFLLRSSNQSNVLQRQLHNLLLKYTHISNSLFTKVDSSLHLLKLVRLLNLGEDSLL